MIWRLVAAALLLPALALAQTDKVELNRITRVEVKDGLVQITGSRTPNFNTFTMSNPARLVIDLSEAVFVGVPESLPGQGVITGIKTASYGSASEAIARVLVGFDHEVETDLKVEGNTLTVKVLKAPLPLATRAGPIQDAGTGPGTQVTQTTAEAQERAEQEQKRQQEQARQAAARAEEERRQKEAQAEREAKAAREQSQAQAAAQQKAEEQRRAQQAEDAKRAEQEARKKAEEDRSAQKLAAKQAQERARLETEQQNKAQAEAAEAARQETLARERADAEAKEAAKRAEEERKARQNAEREAAAEAKKAAEQERMRQQQEAKEAKERAERDRLAEQKAQREAAAAARKRAEEARAEQRQTKAQGGRKAVAGEHRILEFVGFRPAGRGARVFLRTNASAAYSLEEKDERTVVVVLAHTRIGSKNNTRFLDTSFFGTPVLLVNPTEVGDDVHVEVKLRTAVPYQARQNDGELVLEFQAKAT